MTVFRRCRKNYPADPMLSGADMANTLVQSMAIQSEDEKVKIKPPHISGRALNPLELVA
jgi:hypothetical protein